MEKDVHTEHCCIRHGCKYGHVNCTVAYGEKQQSWPCDYCFMQIEEEWDWAHLMNEMYDKGFTEGHKRGSAHAQRLAHQVYGGEK
jgi:hypothetical protein